MEKGGEKKKKKSAAPVPPAARLAGPASVRGCAAPSSLPNPLSQAERAREEGEEEEVGEEEEGGSRTREMRTAARPHGWSWSGKGAARSGCIPGPMPSAPLILGTGLPRWDWPGMRECVCVSGGSPGRGKTMASWETGKRKEEGWGQEGKGGWRQDGREEGGMGEPGREVARLRAGGGGCGRQMEEAPGAGYGGWRTIR